jgi:hypothetical protein
MLQDSLVDQSGKIYHNILHHTPEDGKLHSHHNYSRVNLARRVLGKFYVKLI